MPDVAPVRMVLPRAWTSLAIAASKVCDAPVYFLLAFAEGSDARKRMSGDSAAVHRACPNPHQCGERHQRQGHRERNGRVRTIALQHQRKHEGSGRRHESV